MQKITALLFLFFLLPSVSAQPLSDYVAYGCKGDTDVELPDGSVAECVMEEYVVVFDYSSRWVDAIDRALRLGEVANRIGAVVLIVNSGQDRGYEMAQKMIYGYAMPLELVALPRLPASI
ncbi:MAG: hypothetical protein HN842_00985 [Gammaproteobacteria bacterium]|jgi:hypothetical protein|nr:hypothetical protein [Gammaproteobacteria bacterium]MBT7306757.1 hypothetical protein [Gammaproteobacteria bacterium]